jgi:hypothetical protein
LAKQKAAEGGGDGGSVSQMGMSAAMSGIGMESSALSSNINGSVTGSLGQYGGSSHGASSGAKTSQVSSAPKHSLHSHFH